MADDSDAGHSFYTRRTLGFYDALVLGWFSRMAWCCPADQLVRLHDEHVSADHLDIGVGTGYFLDRCRFPRPDPRIVLLDPNRACLESAAARLSRYRPECVQASALAPLPDRLAGFHSVSLTYVLHCLSGSLATKSIVFDNVATAVEPGGVVFGATLLQGGVTRNRYARSVMAFNNRRGIFSNRDDDLETLSTELGQRFDDVNIDVIGCVAAFSARARSRRPVSEATAAV